METNIIESLKERRQAVRPALGDKVGIVREIRSALPDGRLKEIRPGSVLLLSKIPLSRGERVLITLHYEEGPSERRGRVVDVAEADGSYEIEVVFLH